MTSSFRFSMLPSSICLTYVQRSLSDLKDVTADYPHLIKRFCVLTQQTCYILQVSNTRTTVGCGTQPSQAESKVPCCPTAAQPYCIIAHTQAGGNSPAYKTRTDQWKELLPCSPILEDTTPQPFEGRRHRKDEKSPLDLWISISSAALLTPPGRTQMQNEHGRLHVVRSNRGKAQTHPVW